jgi:hypothetical protein
VDVVVVVVGATVDVVVVVVGATVDVVVVVVAGVGTAMVGADTAAIDAPLLFVATTEERRYFPASLAPTT